MWSNLENVIMRIYIEHGVPRGEAHVKTQICKDFYLDAMHNCKTRKPYLILALNQRLPDSEDLPATACMMLCYMDIFIDMGVNAAALQDYINRQPTQVQNLVRRYCR